MLLGILLTVHILVCIALIGVVLLQRSEGGGLVSSGGGSGFLTARGGSDLLTRTSWILGTIFFVLSLALTMLSGGVRQGGSVTDRFEVESIDPDTLNQPQAPEAPTPTAPLLPGAPAAAPAPGEAPTPTLRNPLELPPAQPAAPAPAAPAQ
ncbi:preprotein translocase subunit SecG [Phenylobacterium terrae]|uniref:Protein-export membrane protein SecG n=1 Tax=Phenylobacterium terrae TaxID=2665495 RepID=A0ABW4N556_9CAUL